VIASVKVPNGGKRVKAVLPAGVHVWSGGFSFQLDLTPVEQHWAGRTAGARRHVFNWAWAKIDANTKAWQVERDMGVPSELRVKPLQARAMYEMFKLELPVWWSDADPSVWVYRKAIDDAVGAHQRWMKGLGDYPITAKKNRCVERFSFAGQDVVMTEAGVVRLPKIGRVKVAG